MNQTEVVDRLNMKEKTIPKINPGFAALCILIAAVLLLAGVGIGYGLHPEQKIPNWEGYAAAPDYEYLVGAAAWQLSAEAHALML